MVAADDSVMPQTVEAISHAKAADVPIIIRDAQGLTLRRPGSVKNLEDLTALVALGKSLRADL